MWNTVGMCAVLAAIFGMISLTVFFIIHKNKAIVGYHTFQQHKEKECKALLFENKN